MKLWRIVQLLQSVFLDLQIKQSSYFDIVHSTQYNMTFIIKNELFAHAKYKKIF